ncbi:hypothetical protein AB0J84_31860 [Micromonospora arborensis]|uniref:hypothetical protein n=1 Tax=Micromonospora arborensis TaxID=2116518 RepID=UPI003446D30D
MPSKVIGVRVQPHVLSAVREALDLPKDASELDTVRAALAHVSNIPPSEQVLPNLGRHPKKRPQAA